MTASDSRIVLCGDQIGLAIDPASQSRQLSGEARPYEVTAGTWSHPATQCNLSSTGRR